MLLVRNYGDPLRRGKASRSSPYAEHTGKIVSVFTSAGAAPFTGLLIEATPAKLVLVTGIDVRRRRAGPTLHIAADKIVAVAAHIS